MGRASQIFWFLNAEKMPSEEELTNYYTHLYVNDEYQKKNIMNFYMIVGGYVCLRLLGWITGKVMMSL
jgi:hypothetical protein